ncbi:MAG: CRISPR-associated endonuclease Cas2 [Rhodobacteraceae bacterium]|nr:CRISPR-associated endonuclease Cas2 [Paracoccaceae bacterium]
MTRFIVCYDIADDKRRHRAVQILEAYGDRIQWSVFELPVTSKIMQKCLNSIMEVLDFTKDGLIIYPLCSRCNKSTQYFGVSLRDTRIGEETVFVV